MTREREPAPELLLQRALGFLTPDAADEARVLSAVQRELAGDVAAPAPAPRAGTTARRTVQGSIAGKLAAVAAFTGAAGFALGFFVGRESSSVSSSSPAEVAAASSSIAAPPSRPLLDEPMPSAPDGTAARVPAALAVEHDVPSVGPVRAESAPRATRSRSTGAPAPSTASTTPLDLRQALALLRAAQSAQRDGRAGAALEQLAELDRRAPADMLAEERLVTRALALCDLNDVDAARQLALALRADNPSSIYQSRLRQSCAGE